MGTIDCPRCAAHITPEEVSAGISLVCPECDETDPEQSASELLEDEAQAPSERPEVRRER